MKLMREETPLCKKHTSPGRAFVMPTTDEWWDSLRWVLLVFTLLILLALLGSFVPYDRVVAEGHPWLPKKHCTGCPFCGMTRSFCAMTAGRLRDAAGWNRGGPVLYVGGWLWLAAFCLIIARRIFKLMVSRERGASWYLNVR